jgi:hypothetical protein
MFNHLVPSNTLRRPRYLQTNIHYPATTTTKTTGPSNIDKLQHAEAKIVSLVKCTPYDEDPTSDGHRRMGRFRSSVSCYVGAMRTRNDMPMIQHSVRPREASWPACGSYVEHRTGAKRRQRIEKELFYIIVYVYESSTLELCNCS